MEGSVITVQTKPPEEKKEIDWSETIIDSFSFLTGAMTIIFLADRIGKWEDLSENYEFWIMNFEKEGRRGKTDPPLVPS